MANRNYKILVERLTKAKKAKEEMELKRNIEFEEKTLSINKNLKV